MSDEMHLTKFPDHILEKTIDNLDLDSRISIRKCCQNLRKLTDKRRCHHNFIGVRLYPEKIMIAVEVRREEFMKVRYVKHAEGCLVKHQGKEKLLKDEDFVDIALQDLKVYIAGSKVTINQLSIIKHGELAPGDDPMFVKIRTLLESLNHQLSVQKLWIEHARTEDVMCVLPLVKPGTLTHLNIDHDWNGIWRPIVETDQWKELECVVTWDAGMPLENFFRFRKVTFYCRNSDSFSVEDLKGFIEVASQPPYDIQYRLFIGVRASDDIEEYLEDVPNLSRNPMYNDPDNSLYHIKIPDCNSYVQIHINDEEVDIRTVREPTLFDPDSEWWRGF